MIKTFTAIVYRDNSWTGGGFHKFNPKESIDKQVNEWVEETGNVVDDIKFSSFNENIQYGPSESNTQRSIFLIATVFYKPKNNQS